MSTDEHQASERERPADQAESRRVYMREYQRALRQERKRLEVSFTVEDYERVRQAAGDHGMKVATFARAAMLAYLDDHFVLPDSERVADLELALRHLMTEVDRVARRVDTRGEGVPIDVAGLNQRLGALEDAASSALREPPRLLELIERQIRRDPHFADIIRGLLDALAVEDS